MAGKKVVPLLAVLFLVTMPVVPSRSLADPESGESPVALAGLEREVRMVRDRFGVPHLYARSDHDVYFMMGYLHAEDRFFQMDVLRRQASGTLAELLGAGPGNQVLNSDIQLRTLGLRRAAERSRAVYPAETQAVLQAYADGVNAWLASQPLPPEYAALEITKARVPTWDVVDSLALGKAIAFGLSFDTIDLANTTALATYQRVGAALGFDGTKLFFDDLFRSAPFDPTVSIPPGVTGMAVDASPRGTHLRGHAAEVEGALVGAARRFLERPPDVPLFAPRGRDEGGSNWWAIGGAHTDTGLPMLASDPHLSLPSPSVFHEVHLVVSPGHGQEPMDVYGVGFPGAPGVVHGYNTRIAWGSTVNPMDVTDFYQERVIVNAAGVPIATLFRGSPEPLVLIPQTYRVNLPGDGITDDVVVVPPGGGVPPATFVVPRRNNGPLVTVPSGPDPSRLTAISVQYSGFCATRELEAFLRFARAGSVDDFKQALQSFDVGSQNWAYADTDGNIAYFTSAELPLREDLQAGFVDGLPPYFIRDGTGARRHEWIRNDAPPPGQALGFEILPFEEMPQVVNPSQGFIANANNDPIGVTLDNDPLNQLRPGGGIFYLSPGYAIGNRMGRIDRLIRAELDTASGGDGRISFDDMMRIQGDVGLVDAEALTPYILRAFDAARLPGAPAPLAALGADPAVAEAAARLRAWDFTAPTGIEDGYDAGDVDGVRLPPTPDEVSKSVAATIYGVWRGQALRNVIDLALARVGLGGVLPPGDRAMIALRNLLDTFGATEGRGASGLNFFDVPGVTLPPAAERDVILLQSLKTALSLLASPAFGPAFAQSTNQEDYRWGKLHRIVFAHPLGALLPGFNIPPGAGFTHLEAGLPGISVDGGFDVVDASSHNPRAASLNAFMFGSGPSRRFIGEAQHRGFRAVQVIPGGASGIPGTPFFGSLLGLWATNDYHEAPSSDGDVTSNQVSIQLFEPARR